MSLSRDDWQGFESFAEENMELQIKRTVTQATPEINFKITPNPTRVTPRSQNKKIIHFKGMNYSKFQNLNFQHIKRQSLKKDVEGYKQQKRMSMCLEHPIKQISVSQSKDEIIPIFRFPSITQNGKLVYKAKLAKSVQQYFSILQNDLLRGSWQTVQTQQGQDDELTFDSKFESGNLQSVRKVGNDYHLYLTPDTNTQGHRQWFYFTVANTKALKVRIFIHGFKKKLSLFQDGMRPYGKKIQEGVQKWRAVGFNVKYLKQQTKIAEKRQKGIFKKQSPLFYLSFELQMEDNSTYCLASCIPYTYTFLKSQIAQLKMNMKNIVGVQQSRICKSLAGLDIPLITINSQVQTQMHDIKFVIINARSHPGQSSSSWVVQGIIEQIFTSQAFQNIIKQNNLVIKIIPMLNPDGVYMGNYRTGVMGIDFNRLFLSGQPSFFPQIQALRNVVKTCKAQGHVKLYMDLHGHSILPGCFIYGPDPIFSPASQLKTFQEQLITSTFFASRHSIQGQIGQKGETSRVYFQVQQGVYSLTCQNSLGLYYHDKQKNIKQQFLSKDWRQFGKQMIAVILSKFKKKNSPCIESQANNEKFYDIQKTIRNFETDPKNLKNHINQENPKSSKNIVKEKETSNSNPIPNSIQSLNDSDNQSEDLSPQKKLQLFTIVKTALDKKQTNQKSNSQSLKKIQFRGKQKISLEKGQTFMNFKQYRFADQTSFADWQNQKRLLSIPRILKSQKINQSYAIPKTAFKPFTPEFIFQPLQAGKKIKTQSLQQSRKKISSCLQYGKPLDKSKQRLTFQHSFAKRN